LKRRINKLSEIRNEQSSSEPKVKALIPMYEPLEVVKCKKCEKVIAEQKNYLEDRL